MHEAGRTPKNPEDDFALRVMRYLDEQLSPEEVEKLNEELLQENAKRKRFIELSLVDSVLREEVTARAGADASGRNAGKREKFLLAMTEEPSLSEKRSQSGDNRWQFPMNRHRALAVAAGVVLVAGVAMTAILFTMHRGNDVRVNPLIPSVKAMCLAGEMDAVWGDPVPSNVLQAGQVLRLKSGRAEVELPTGGSVVLEGPAELRLDAADSLTLSRGKLAATVHGGGLSVITPNAKVTDLGTQFGVEVVTDQRTNVAVLQGRVLAEARDSDSKIVLVAKQAASISSAHVTVNSTPANPDQYVFDLPTRMDFLDVVDLICGGDGTTHRRGLLIDARTGDIGDLVQIGSFKGDGDYHAVPESPVIDGVFVPAGKSVASQIDSAGDRYAFDNSSSLSYLHITTGGEIPPASYNVVQHDSPMQAIMGGINYAEGGHALLAMHANKGLTIDLAKVRALHPGVSISRFDAVLGNSYRPKSPLPGGIHQADAYLLVDGAVRFRRLALAENSDPVLVRVDLRPEDRFLTFVATDAGHDISGDHVLWADPQLRYRIASH